MDVSAVGVFMAAVAVAMRAKIMTVTGMHVSTVAENDQCGVMAVATVSHLATSSTLSSNPPRVWSTEMGWWRGFMARATTSVGVRPW